MKEPTIHYNVKLYTGKWFRLRVKIVNWVADKLLYVKYTTEEMK